MPTIRKTPDDKFADTVNKILEEYNKNVITETKEITKRIGKEGVKLLKAYSKAAVGRHSRRRTYSTQWTSTVVEETQTGVQVVLHSNKYQLPHLLEYEHATGPKRGGRFGGKPHIHKAEEAIIDMYVKALEKGLGG